MTAQEGYFGERLAAARKQLFREWAEVSKQAQAEFPHTDILGALLLAGQILTESPRATKVLILFSDMRHEALGIDIESPDRINGIEVMKSVERGGLIADLSNVEVHVAGAVAPSRHPAYWASLRAFWAKYFESAGARLSRFSVTREVPRLDQPR